MPPVWAVTQLQAASGHRRGPAHERISGQHQSAIAALVQPVLTFQHIVNRRRPALAVIVEIANLDHRGIAIDLVEHQIVTGKPIAITHEHKPCRAEAAPRRIHNHSASRALKGGQNIIRPAAGKRSVLIRPVGRAGFPRPVAAMHRSAVVTAPFQ